MILFKVCLLWSYRFGAKICERQDQRISVSSFLLEKTTTFKDNNKTTFDQIVDSPDGIYDLTSNVLYGPPPPSAELMAAKRFALEAEMAGDPVKLNNLRVKCIFNYSPKIIPN